VARRIAIDALPGRAAAIFEGAEHGAQVSFFISTFEPGDGPGLHRHPYEETFVIETGSARFEVDGEQVEAGVDEIVVVPAGAAHRIVGAGDGPIHSVSIHPAGWMVTEWIEGEVDPPAEPAVARRASVGDLPGRDAARKYEGVEIGAQVSGFFNRHPPGDGPQLHRHPYEETFILEAGSARFEADGEAIEASGGEIVIVPAGAAHRFVNTGDGALSMVSIHPNEKVLQEDL
jgi:mannose-6-phosphate isomerase-like protein (cupin superfamily)